MKLMMKCYLCWCNFSDFKNLFPRDPMGNFRYCYFRLLFIFLPVLQNAKRFFKLLWYLVFVHGKPKLLDPLWDFVLKSCPDAR